MGSKLNWTRPANRVGLITKRQREYEERERRLKAAAHSVQEKQMLAATTVPVTPAATITSEEVLVTPDQAMAWLEGHTHNRPLSHYKVIDYGVDMKAGRWDLNGEPIIFDWNGVLQDGQHRLWASIESKTPFRTMVIRGVDPITFRSIDTGKARRASDLLGMEHYPDRNVLAAAAALVLDYEQGRLRSSKRIRNRDILDFVKVNPGLSAWVTEARRGKPRLPVASQLAAVMYVAAKTYPDKAAEFSHKIRTGEGLTLGSPILTVRNRLLSERGLNRAERMELLVRSWNAFLDGRQMSKATLSPASEFPRIKGDPRA